MTGAVVAPEHVPRTGAPIWKLRKGMVSLTSPLVMGIINVTPDSFSDGGAYDEPHAALRRARQMVLEGAGMIDVGGESTRPGAVSVSAGEEAARVIPVIRLLKSELAVPISVDTRKAAVAKAALAAGADVVNDISGLGDPEMAAVVAGEEAGLVLMHMRGTPATMQENPRYADVAMEVRDELENALAKALAAGVDSARVVVDPGIGFAKNHDHNLRLLADLAVLHSLGQPLLLGVSRKAFIGTLLGGVAPSQRAVGTAAACVVGLLAGARIFRAHDVQVVHEALTVAEAIRAAAPAA
jgi:dihydropteroate synthase